MADHDTVEVVPNGTEIELALGCSLHPGGHYPVAEIVDIELLRGPYGPWYRFTYRTPDGIVHAMVSPRYEPGSELYQIVFDAFEWAPERLKPALLIGCQVPCWVTWVVEHGAEVASASRLDRRR